MPLRPDMEPKEFLEIFHRKKWLIIFLIFFVMFGAIVYCVIVPNKYQSSTTILVIPQRVPERFVSSTVTYGVEERLTATSHQILSRTRLMKVIDELGLYHEQRSSTSPEILAEKMRKNIGIDILRGRDSFVLSFVHEDPKIAMLTASKMASFFIDENLKFREQLAVGTSEFLDTQVQEVKKKLEEQEEKVKHYKLTYLGELPQEMEANLNTLSRLQDQRRTNAEAIARAEDRRVLMESQISSLQNQIRTLEGGAEDPTDLLIDELYAKRKQLDDLSAKYTPNYPSIIQIRNEIERLEERIGKSEQAGNPGVDNTKKTVLPLRKRKAFREREEVERVRSQVRSLELDITALKREQEEVQRASNAIQSKVARLPQREQEMISLTRDYNNLKQSYDELLKKKLEANVSQNLEVRQKGEQFQILDPANLPVSPVAPNRQRILGLAFIASLVVGFGGALGLEFIDPTLRSSRDFKHFFELPILATIPIIQNEEYARKQSLRRTTVLGGVLSFMVAVIAFVLLFLDKIRTILQF